MVLLFFFDLDYVLLSEGDYSITKLDRFLITAAISEPNNSLDYLTWFYDHGAYDNEKWESHMDYILGLR